MSVIGVHVFPVSFTRFEHHQHNMGAVKALSPGAKLLAVVAGGHKEYGCEQVTVVGGGLAGVSACNTVIENGGKSLLAATRRTQKDKIEDRGAVWQEGDLHCSVINKQNEFGGCHITTQDFWVPHHPAHSRSRMRVRWVRHCRIVEAAKGDLEITTKDLNRQ